MKTKEFFLKNNIVKDKNAKSLNLFDKICPDFTIYKKMNPSDCALTLWKKYHKATNNKNNGSLNGCMFELIISAILINKELLPFYKCADVLFVKGTTHDFLLYTEECSPIVLSAKTSLRERWKQADLEAFALHNVYRTSEYYLLTFEKEESETRLKNKDQWMGLSDLIYCFDSKFDTLIEQLRKNKYIEAEPVQVVTSNIIVR